MEDGYSSTYTARLIDTSQRIMSGNLQRGPLGINTNASSIWNKPGVQHDRHLTFVKKYAVYRNLQDEQYFPLICVFSFG